MIDLLLGFSPFWILVGLAGIQLFMVLLEYLELRQDARDSEGYIEDSRAMLRERGLDPDEGCPKGPSAPG